MACATIIRCGGSASTTTNVHSGSSKRTHRVIASWSVWPISRCSSADALNSLCHVSWLSTPTAIWYPLKYLPCFFCVHCQATMEHQSVTRVKLLATTEWPSIGANPANSMTVAVWYRPATVCPAVQTFPMWPTYITRTFSISPRNIFCKIGRKSGSTLCYSFTIRILQKFDVTTHSVLSETVLHTTTPLRIFRFNRISRQEWTYFKLGNCATIGCAVCAPFVLR